MPTHRRLPILRDTIARNVLVESWLPLVTWVVQRTRLRRLTRDEAAAAGQDGLLYAAEVYDESRGVRFATYAVHWIRSHIWLAEEKALLIRVPAGQQRPRKDAARELTRRRQLIERDAARALCVPARLRFQGDGEAAYSGGSPEPAAPEEAAGPCAEELIALERALPRLPGQWRRVLDARFREGRTLQEVGVELGVTRERVRQIEVKALAKLREVMAGCGA